MKPADVLAVIRASTESLRASLTGLAERVAGPVSIEERARARAAALAAGLVLFDEDTSDEVARNAAQSVLNLIAQEGD